MFTHLGSDMEVDNDDRVWADKIKFYIENDDGQLPPVGRFNWGQKLYFWAMTFRQIRSPLSGVVLWYVAELPWYLHCTLRGNPLSTPASH